MRSACSCPPGFATTLPSGAPSNDCWSLEAPAHTKVDIRYVEPRYRVGVQASIGLDGVMARMPRGVTLDSSRLRQGSVLSGRPFGPHLEVDNARVGTTTLLT